jgi:hypothetical protein
MSEAIVKRISDAVAAVEEASVPEDLRASAFNAAFWGDAVDAAKLVTPRSAATAKPSVGGDWDANPADGYAQIAERLGVTEEQAQFAFELIDGDVRLRIPPSLFNSTRKDAEIEIIYLLAAARQAAGIESATSARLLKGACDDRDKEDTNFGKILTGLHGQGLTIGGPSQTRTVTLNAGGFERAGKILGQIGQAVG